MSELYFDKDEEVLWSDYKMIFGIPFPFTKYTLTTKKMYIESGILRYSCEEIKLFRICDVSISKGIIERACNTGTLNIRSTDKSEPIAKIGSIKNVGKIKQILDRMIELDRKNKGFRTGEFIS